MKNQNVTDTRVESKGLPWLRVTRSNGNPRFHLCESNYISVNPRLETIVETIELAPDERGYSIDMLAKAYQKQMLKNQRK